ncbi:MAG: hypothetical protein HY403_03960 [Elusimicrobia bacterium]|nr:hypothetical protein [Elusimicrobiota bacterium]
MHVGACLDQRIEVNVVAVLLLGYWAALTLVPVPGFEAGLLDPEGNLAAYVDRAVFGRHIWRAARVYDPEGVLSTVPAIATTLIGVLAGRWLMVRRSRRSVIRGLFVAGIVGLALGAIWDVWFPINKALWTSSYAALTAGAALIGLSACHWIVEVRGYSAWTRPFVVLGVNALALFLLSSLAARLIVVVKVDGGRSLQAWLFEHLFAPWAAPANASLAYAGLPTSRCGSP